ncbi:MAG TPA: hypothetical protein VF178_08795 [Gemmatimonadaceae bacterium]
MTRVAWAKALVSALGLTVGIAGMALGRRWVVGVAVGLLAVAFVLRFAERKTVDDPPS